MVYIIVQVIAGLCTFMGLGSVIDKNASKFDRIIDWLATLAFLCFILYIEVVLK